MLNKKKILITISVLLVILSLSVLSIFAFEFRQPAGNGTMISPSNPPSLEAVQNLVGIINFQTEIGQLRASDFKLVYWIPGYGVYTIVAPPETTASFSFSGDSVSITFSNTVFQYIYQDGYGFMYRSSFSSASSILLSYLYYSDYPVTSSSFNFTGFNSQATFGTNNLNTFDSYSYYEYIYDSVIDRVERESQIRQEAQSEGYSEGFDFGVENGYRLGFDEGEEEGYSEGYSEGESVGYSSGRRDGFEEGRDEGYTFGFDDGYDEGESVGYSSGHQDGYDEGYSEGYSEGYETGYQSGLDDGSGSEPLQIYTAYIFRFDENNALQYSWYNQTFGLFAWVDFDDGFDPTKPAYTFIVRLTESDLNNSSTQIELPFDFISSPGNRDYSVASFDPEFLTGYGRSLSLFVTTSRSYNNGYNVGLQDGADILDGISDISAKPIIALRDALDFELFGVNIGLVVVALVSVLIVFAAYKFVKKIFPI